MAEGKRAQGKFRDQHGAGLVQELDHASIALGHAVGIGSGTPGGRHPLGVEQVLGPPGDAVQRTAAPAPRHLAVGAARLGQCVVFHQGHDRFQLTVEAFETGEIELGQFDAADGAARQPLAQQGDRSKRDIGFVGGQLAGPRRRAAETCLGWKLGARQTWIEDAGGTERVTKVDPALGERAVLLCAEGAHDLVAVAGTVAHAREPFGRGDVGCRDFR